MLEMQEVVHTKLASGSEYIGYKLSSNLLLIPQKMLPDRDYLKATLEALKDSKKLEDLKHFSDTGTQCFLKISEGRGKQPWWAPVRTYTDALGRTLVLLQIDVDRVNFYNQL
ncbi:hypothetical protein ACFLZK_02410 [Patescibacteria group bacterium]